VGRQRINHKNVLKVLPTDREKSYVYYVTEFIEGQTLRQWLAANPKPYIPEIRK